MKEYYASVCYHGVVNVKVKAKNKRVAKKLISGIVTNKKIKRKDIQFGEFDIEEY